MMKEIIDNFENAMKKGFISALILMVLERETCHGYKLKKAIEERTLNVWKVPSSTLYTVLKDMFVNELISFTEEQESGRIRKVYTITDKGKELLKMMLEKISMMRKSISSIISITLGVDEAVLPEHFPGPDIFEILIGEPHKKNIDEKLQLLEFHKQMLTRKIIEMNLQKKNLEKAIQKLKNKIM